MAPTKRIAVSSFSLSLFVCVHTRTHLSHSFYRSLTHTTTNSHTHTHNIWLWIHNDLPHTSCPSSATPTTILKRMMHTQIGHVSVFHGCCHSSSDSL